MMMTFNTVNHYLWNLKELVIELRTVDYISQYFCDLHL